MSEYIMEDVRESSRLADKVDDPGAWVERYFAQALRGAKSMLCVGCGPGLFLEAIALRYPSVEVVGLDISPARIDAAKTRIAGLKNASVNIGDALALPFASGTFDVIICRLLLEYLKDAAGAVEEMARVGRSGARVILQDLDGQLVWHFPPDPELDAAIASIVTVLARTGFDPFIGRKLYTHARMAALENISVQTDTYHLYAGRIGERSADLWRRKLAIAYPLVAAALGDEAAHQTVARFMEYLRRPDSLTYSTLFTVIGTRQ
jgi:SAM-dependent methyltransferase